MRTITIQHNVYKFNELSDKAKENAKEQIRSIYHSADILTKMITEDLEYLFPNSDLDVQWSLASCQGDGVNIYGEVTAEDIIYCVDTNMADGLLKKYEGYISERNKNDILEYAEICSKINLPYNDRYCYCLSDRSDVGMIWEEELEAAEVENINSMALFKLSKLVTDMFADICNYWKEEGYKWLYEISDSECEDYDLEFYEDGKIFDC